MRFRRRFTRTMACVTAGAILGWVGPAAAAEQQLIVADVGTVQRWTAHTVQSVGKPFDVTFNFTTDNEPLQVGVMIYNADNSWRGGFHWTSFLFQDSHHVDLDVVPGVPVHVQEQRNAYGFPLRVGAGFAPLPGTVEAPQIFKLLVWVIGDTSRGWRYDVTGPGLTVEADDTQDTTTGDAAILALSKDFQSPAKAGVQASIVPVPGQLPYGFGGGARVIYAGQRTFAVDSFLFGTYQIVGQGSPFEHRRTWRPCRPRTVFRATARRGLVPSTT